MQPPQISLCPTCLKFEDFIPSNPTGKVYLSAAQSLTVSCPSGVPATVNLPAGIIGFNLTFTLGNPPYPNLTLNCVSGMISIPVPDDTTQAQLDALVNSLLQQCLTQIAINIGCASGVFFNTTQSISCPPPGQSSLVNLTIPGALPSGVITNTSTLTIVTGAIQSTISVADANAKALQLLTEIFATGNAKCIGGD
jgi:hypothetical protein